jgi:hypothetical protein
MGRYGFTAQRWTNDTSVSGVFGQEILETVAGHPVPAGVEKEFGSLHRTADGHPSAQ